MSARVLPALALVLVVSAAGPAAAQKKTARAPLSLWRYRARVAAATVMLPERGCAGAVVRTGREILTAAHCVPEDATTLMVRMPNGTEQNARVARRDGDTDLALLELDAPATMSPLTIADDVPRRGASLLFVGRTDRKSRTQIVHVERVDRCPSLPTVPNALFTSLEARPGDSGAPLVDWKGRVAAVVHGGARCEILVPTAPAAAMRLDAPAAPRPAPEPSNRATPGEGWLFERTDHGIRFRWSFHWSSS